MLKTEEDVLKVIAEDAWMMKILHTAEGVRETVMEKDWQSAWKRITYTHIEGEIL